MTQKEKYALTTKIILIGPSGTGKSSIADELCRRFNLNQLQSYTTRPKRYPNEKGHIFVDEFIEEDIIASTYFNGYYYWTTNEQFNNSDIIIFDLDGIKCLDRDDYIVIGLKCDIDKLKLRIPDRLERINHDIEKFKGYEDYCDFLIDTDRDFNEVIEDIIECCSELTR